MTPEQRQSLEIISGTTSDSLFREQAKVWPGLREWISIWPLACSCGRESCIRTSLQKAAHDWDNHHLLGGFLNLIDGLQVACIQEDISPLKGLAKIFNFVEGLARLDPGAIHILLQTAKREL